MLTDKIEQIKKEKGINSDLFKPLDEYFANLNSFNEKTKEIAKTLFENLKDEIDFSYNMPFNVYDIQALDSKFREEMQDKADKIKFVIAKKFSNLIFDDPQFYSFVRSLPEFSSEQIINYFIQTYGIEEDYLSLIQIQEKVLKSVPYPAFESKIPSEIPKVGKKGLRFETSDKQKVKAISQFVQIILGKEDPSYAKGWQNPEEGNQYSNELIESMHFYKKSNVTIVFLTESHLNKFLSYLFKSPQEIMELIK
jgi:ABC-type glycerol-3-phosphate transport system substrate-binding protein